MIKYEIYEENKSIDLKQEWKLKKKNGFKGNLTSQLLIVE